LSGWRKPGGFREPGRLTTPVGCLVGGVEHGLPCKSVTCAVREPPGWPGGHWGFARARS
jgi:hypothetical protein